MTHVLAEAVKNTRSVAVQTNKVWINPKEE